MLTINPFLWFNADLEEAINFYAATFKNMTVSNISDLGGGVRLASFEIEGQKFTGMQADGPFKFTEAISFFINCDTQEEVDFLWDRLSEGGEIQSCGWLKDKFGLSWQVIPKALMTMMSDENPAKAGATMQAMMQMQKIETSVLKAAYDLA